MRETTQAGRLQGIHPNSESVSHPTVRSHEDGVGQVRRTVSEVRKASLRSQVLIHMLTGRTICSSKGAGGTLTPGRVKEKDQGKEEKEQMGESGESEIHKGVNY